MEVARNGRRERGDSLMVYSAWGLDLEICASNDI